MQQQGSKDRGAVEDVRGLKWQERGNPAAEPAPQKEEDVFGFANDPVLKKLQQSAVYAVPSPGTTNDELYRLETAVTECLTSNGWWFTGAGLAISSYFSYNYNSIRPLAVGLVVSPTLDYVYARHHCKPILEAYDECKAELTKRYGEEIERVREKVTAAYSEGMLREQAAGRSRPQYQTYQGPAERR